MSTRYKIIIVERYCVSVANGADIIFINQYKN